MIVCVCKVQPKPVGTCMHLYHDSQGFFWPSKTGQPIRWGRMNQKAEKQKNRMQGGGGERKKEWDESKGRMQGIHIHSAAKLPWIRFSIICPFYISFSLFEFFSSLHSPRLSEMIATEKEWEKWMLMKWKKVPPVFKKTNGNCPTCTLERGWERESEREKKRWESAKMHGFSFASKSLKF